MSIEKIDSWTEAKELIENHYPDYCYLAKCERPVQGYKDFYKNFILVEVCNNDIDVVRKYFGSWYKDFCKRWRQKHNRRTGVPNDDYVLRCFRDAFHVREFQTGWSYYLLIDKRGN